MADVVDAHHQKDGLGTTGKYLREPMVNACGVVAGYAPVADVPTSEQFVPVAGKLGEAVSQHDDIGAVDGTHIFKLLHPLVIVVERPIGDLLGRHFRREQGRHHP